MRKKMIIFCCATLVCLTFSCSEVTGELEELQIEEVPSTDDEEIEPPYDPFGTDSTTVKGG